MDHQSGAGFYHSGLLYTTRHSTVWRFSAQSITSSRYEAERDTRTERLACLTSDNRTGFLVLGALSGATRKRALLVKGGGEGEPTLAPSVSRRTDYIRRCAIIGTSRLLRSTYEVINVISDGRHSERPRQHTSDYHTGKPSEISRRLCWNM